MTIETAAQLLLQRRTKIIATLGPASLDPASIARLNGAGVNAFRLNMAYGDRAQFRTACENVRAAGNEARTATALIADVGGRSMRIGKLPGGALTLASGDVVTVTTRDGVAEPGLIPCSFGRLPRTVSTGDRVLLRGGRLELRVEAVEGDDVRCTVVRGGTVKDNASVNLPGVADSGDCLTDADVDDVRLALQLGVDFLALSRLGSARDVRDLQALIRESGRPAKVIAKISRREALTDFTAILAAADVIMVARGDLGAELPPEQVPIVQRQLVDRARTAHKPVIVATQMLESMIENQVPTRAEVADVCATVLSGADAIMLSAETAVGGHALAAAEMTDRIARQAEGYLWGDSAFGTFESSVARTPPIPVEEAVARSTADLSRQLRARAVMVLADGEVSAVTVSSARPAAPVVSLSPDARTCRWENLLWGVVPVLVEGTDLAHAEATSRRLARELGLAQEGDAILLVRGDRAEGGMRVPSITILTV